MQPIKRYFIAFLIFFPFIFFNCKKERSLPEEVVKSIEKRIQNGTNPSIVIGIIDENGSSFYNFGMVREGGNEVDEHTIYEIGSISKTFTAILLADQVINSQISLDDPINQYLEIEVPYKGPKEITIGSLSDHTSGLPRMPNNFKPANPKNPYADYTVDQMFDFISSYEPSREVGAEFEYSNLAQGLLGHILASNAGMSYENLMIKTIADPLGMNETKIVFDENMKCNLAIGHANGAETDNWDIPTLAGAGAIRSSTSDMLKYLAANLGLKETSLRDAMEMTHQPRHDKAGEFQIGLGWFIKKGSDGDIIHHGGGTGGYRTFAGFVKELKKGVVVFTNSTTDANDLGFYLLDSESELKKVKTSITVVLRQVIDSTGIDQAIKIYNEIRENQRDDYDYNEDQINQLGYHYLDENVNAALAIFKVNKGLYPSSYNVYDSYAEALFKDGQRDKSIEYYKKSLEIFPGNTNAIDKLKEMGVEEEDARKESYMKELKSYEGNYKTNDAFEIVITRDSTHLFGQGNLQPKVELFPKGKHRFYLKEAPVEIIFHLENEEVVSLTVNHNGQKIVAEKE